VVVRAVIPVDTLAHVMVCLQKGTRHVTRRNIQISSSSKEEKNNKI